MYAKYWKRFFDFTLSLLALIVLSPVLLILTIVGAIAMRGNPFFVQPRPGRIDPKTGKERRKCNYRNYRSPASGVNAAGIHRILGRYDYPVKEIKRNADRKQSAKTHQGYGVFWQADVFSRREP